jgi:hypothetical protein
VQAQVINESLTIFPRWHIKLYHGHFFFKTGSSVLSGVKADLYYTGEMSHHEVLACIEKGIAVVLTEHSNTERGYLPILKARLEKQLGDDEITIHVSINDKDPLTTI